ncbi:MAG TPA: PqqD family protein [Gemmatimonadales bacterium]
MNNGEATMRYHRAPGIEAAPMQDETVLFDPNTKKFCILNATAAHLWESLERPCSAAELAASIVGAFDGVDPKIAERDVQVALKDLVGLGIVGASGADA